MMDYKLDSEGLVIGEDEEFTAQLERRKWITPVNTHRLWKWALIDKRTGKRRRIGWAPRRRVAEMRCNRARREVR